MTSSNDLNLMDATSKAPGTAPDGPSGVSGAADSGIDPSADLTTNVAAILDRIRPAIRSDGGDVELVEVTDAGIVRVRFHGACVGCPSSSMTLQGGIERRLREILPVIQGVEAVN